MENKIKGLLFDFNGTLFFDSELHIRAFKKYFTDNNETVYENPSPGNKQGGITTLEDKSCGCVQKGGSAPIVDVIDYGNSATKSGLNLLDGPGNDIVSSTALTAAGLTACFNTALRYFSSISAPMITMRPSATASL